MATTTNGTREKGVWCAAHYDAGRERAWHLSILVGPEVQAWVAHAMESGEPVALGWSNDSSALDVAELPAHPGTVSFVTLPEWSALVPEGALEPGSEARHLSLVHGGLPTGALRDELVASLGATCIYVHDDEAERNVLDRFPNARPVPMQGLMVRAVLARCNEGPTVLLHRSHQSLEVAIASGGRVLLSNTFPARTSQDLLYFTLLAVEGSGLKPTEVQLHHSGTHLTSHERDLLHRYFTNERTAVRTLNEQGANDPMEMHRWLALMEQFACVS
ncbi:MAG: DUF3822 family protein [Flavobacteriales bacterium]|nr:DUF3822 family protein [Flavobacteriales bacterium]